MSADDGGSVLQGQPLLTVFLGILIIGLAWVVLRYGLPYNQWLDRTFFGWLPGKETRRRMLGGRWYRVWNIYFGAAFLLLVGMATMVAGLMNLVR